MSLEKLWKETAMLWKSREKEKGKDPKTIFIFACNKIMLDVCVLILNLFSMKQMMRGTAMASVTKDVDKE